MQNFNSLGSLVLEISAFQYEACHGFRAGASVHKLFVGGVYVNMRTFTSPEALKAVKIFTDLKASMVYGVLLWTIFISF